MLLNREIIQSKGLITDSVDTGFQDAGYNIHIGEMIKSNGDIVNDYHLPPGEIIEALSLETIALPPNILAYASIKTQLCDEGVLAINIGIVDPGYHGQLSTTLLNFGKYSHFFTTKDVFLRLTFHEYDPVCGVEDITKSKEQYRKEKKKKMVNNYSESFLNIERTSSKAAEEVFGNFKKNLIIWVPVVAFLLTIGTFLVIYGSNYALFKSIQMHSIIDSTIANTDIKLLQLQKQTKILDQLVNNLLTDKNKIKNDSEQIKREIKNIQFIIQKMRSSRSNK